MAVLHDAQLVPSKPELLRRWLPTRSWWAWGDASLSILGAYRFDDPAGEVGIETHLLQVEGGPVLQAPLTYRGAPLATADLVTTMQHSVLGERWVYDGCTDPVYATALATAMVTGGTEAELLVTSEAGLAVREATTTVSGSGSPGEPVPSFDAPAPVVDKWWTTLHGDGLTITVWHELDIDAPMVGDYVLTGLWPGLGVDAVLATARKTATTN